MFDFTLSLMEKSVLFVELHFMSSYGSGMEKKIKKFTS